MSWQNSLALWLPYVPALLLAVSVHESAHGLTARLLGDDTASRAGRISLYPPRHFDAIGFLLVPAFCLTQLGLPFAYGKPAPVDPGKLRAPKGGFSLVALAGPLSHFALALLSALACRALLPFASSLGPLLMVASASVTVNLSMGLLHSLPLPGFDGMKALYVFLPDAWCWSLNRGARASLVVLALLAAMGRLNWLPLALEGLLQVTGKIFGIPF